MTAEMWTIIGVGDALAGQVISGQRALKYEFGTLATGVRAIEEGLADLRDRIAHLEAWLEGFREAITGHRADRSQTGF